MDKPADPNEIKIDPRSLIDPRVTNIAREERAGLRDKPPKPEPRGDMTQTQFTRAKPLTPAEKAKQDKQFDAIMRKRESERKAKGYAKGGTVRGGGCETKGKTRGRFV